MSSKRRVVLAIVLTALLTSIQAALARNNEEVPGDGATPAMSYLTEPVQQLAGPRRTVTVGGFDSTGAFSDRYGQWDIGGGLAAMLTSALVETGQFMVIERSALSDILAEQELSAAGMLRDTATRAEIGRMAGVQLLVYGAVTEFDTRADGGGISVGLSNKLWKGGLGKKKSEGVVAFDFRVVDTTTGEIIESHSVAKTIEQKGFDLTVGYEGVSLGDSNFSGTPLGQASREAINEAVHLIIENASRTPWSGSVVSYDGREIYINAGARSGVQEGDEFRVERIDRLMTDPGTGEVLLVEKSELGRIRIAVVQEKISAGLYEPTSNSPPQRGDIVVLPTVSE